MAFSDAYQVLVHYNYIGVVGLNAFTVEKVDAGLTAQDVREAYIDSIVPLWREIVHDTCTITTMDVISLAEPTDFEFGFPVNISGDGTGAQLASHAAVSIRYNRTRRDVRHGYSRFFGIQEDSITGNNLNGGFITQVQALATALISTWNKDTPFAAVCNLHVVKRVFVPATEEHGAYYRLPQNSSEYISYRPTTFFINPFISSQVSRKPY